jgi:hypothetical protein
VGVFLQENDKLKGGFMKLYDYETWLANLRDYWINIIDSSVVTQLDNYINSIRSNILSYKENNSLKDTFEDSIITLISYIKIKYDYTFINDPGVPDLIPNNDLKNWFKLFTYDLNENYSVFFNYISQSDPMGTTTYILETTITYDNLIQEISQFAQNDIDTINNFRDVFPSAIRKKMNYQAINQPKGFTVGINSKNHIITAMYGEEVLEKFNWSIFGLNTNDPNV